MMKYPNVLGKDFKKKEDAYKYFSQKKNEFDIPSCDYVLLTEETPIKQSEMIKLYNDYGSHTQEWETRKAHTTGIDRWCIMRNYVDHIQSFSLGFFRNKKENESKFNTILPEAATAKKIFICFGPGYFNNNEILEGALRNEIRYQAVDYRKNYNHGNQCAHCKHVFQPDQLEVDHLREFKLIKKEFLDLYGEEFIMKCLYKESDGVEYRIRDTSPNENIYPDSPREAWVIFHKERATYQMLCKKGKEGLPGCHPLKTYKGKRIT